jgi:hypothetical protein
MHFPASLPPHIPLDAEPAKVWYDDPWSSPSIIVRTLMVALTVLSYKAAVFFGAPALFAVTALAVISALQPRIFFARNLSAFHEPTRDAPKPQHLEARQALPEFPKVAVEAALDRTALDVKGYPYVPKNRFLLEGRGIFLNPR